MNDQARVPEAVLQYLALDYGVLPLEPNSKCLLTRLVPNGLRQVTISRVTVARWIEAAPNANWGLLTPGEVLVLDVDKPEAWPALLEQHPELAEAPRQRTPRGGCHVFLQLPEIDGLNTKLSTTSHRLDGVDLRGLGRAYVAVAPSVVDGKPYTWEVPLVAPYHLPEIPPALLKQLLSPPPAPAPRPAPSGDGLVWLAGWAAEQLAAVPWAKRMSALFDIAKMVGGWVHHGLDEDEAAAALIQAGMRADLREIEARYAVLDGLLAGQMRAQRKG